MVISEITNQIIASQLNEELSALSEAEITYIGVLKDSAIAYVMSETGINGVDTEDVNGRKLDDYEDLTYVVLCLIADMYDNRQTTVDGKNINRVIESTLKRHQFNLVPQSEG